MEGLPVSSPTRPRNVSPRSGPPPERLRPGASIEEIVATLAADAVDHGDTASCVFGVLSGPSGPTLRFVPLDGAHPSAALLGWRAPRRWAALGFVGSGTARGDVPGAIARVVVITAVARDGTSATALIGEEGPLPVCAEQGSGRLADLLRLSLGLATPQADQATMDLWSIVWLDRLLNTALGALSPLSWDRAVRLHPLCPAGDAPRPETAAGAFADHEVARCSWEQIRRLAAGDRAQLPGLTPADAAWLDAGSFSRWVLTELPSAGQLAEALAELIPASLGRHIATVITSAVAVT